MISANLGTEGVARVCLGWVDLEGLFIVGWLSSQTERGNGTGLVYYGIWVYNEEYDSPSRADLGLASALIRCMHDGGFFPGERGLTPENTSIRSPRRFPRTWPAV